MNEGGAFTSRLDETVGESVCEEDQGKKQALKAAKEKQSRPVSQPRGNGIEKEKKEGG